MRKLRAVMLVTAWLTFALVTEAQHRNQCIQCSVHYDGSPACTNTWGHGACVCVLYQAGLPRQQFGLCDGGTGCYGKLRHETRLIEAAQKSSPAATTPDDVNVVDVDPQEHPWIKSEGFADTLEPYSHDLAKLVRLMATQYKSPNKYNPACGKSTRGGLVDVGAKDTPQLEFFTILRVKSRWKITIDRSIDDGTGTGRVKDNNAVPKETLLIDSDQWEYQRDGETVTKGTIP